MHNAKKIVIGIHVDADSAILNATLLCLHEHTGIPVEVVLLIDCEDALPAIERIRKIRVGNGAGRAASFNHLVRTMQADLYIFMENGIQVGPGWLRHMIDALDADPKHGLAGPSTNRCWNEQGVLPRMMQGAYAVDIAAEDVARRFAGKWRTLGPLHSLSDFCYAVKREVINTVGAADESYGAGPCWEMDYNVRAARAGFKGVWACGAFAHRSAPTSKRISDEAQRMEASKQRYQDKFCSLLEQPGKTYSAHCKGDGCGHFAQTHKISIHLPMQTGTHRIAPSGDLVPSALPLVSCIMPTRGRPHFVAQSIRYFQRQDYPNTELVIVWETESDLPEKSDDPRIKYVQSPLRTSIGSKRNLAVRHASGSIIAQWDDDDWYAPTRLSAQVEPILQNIADITGLKDTLFLNIRDEECWQVRPALFRRLFVENVCGGTLVYRRSNWESAGHYPATSLREDADFMTAAIRKGARLCRVPAHQQFVYIRHDSNTWKFKEGSHVTAADWQRVEIPDYLHGDREFYASQSGHSCIAVETPLVSCIMPTANRRSFVPQAISHFLSQRYDNKELIIVDDGIDSAADLIPDVPSIRYLRLEARTTIGAKRNMACVMAHGSIVMHWDDDDWMSPDWIGSQVATLTNKKAEVCGLTKVFFHAPALGQAWQYIYDGQRPWVCGGTLCYTKAFWERNRFPDIDVGEDNAFVWSSRTINIAVNDNCNLYVATIHADNTSPKQTKDRRWHACPVQDIVRILAGQSSNAAQEPVSNRAREIRSGRAVPSYAGLVSLTDLRLTTTAN